ncbi:MAG: tetrapyrrole methylase [Spirochaetes bacterium]|nr:tetrapyrrole methylase [Spirochaetota bacterium]
MKQRIKLVASCFIIIAAICAGGCGRTELPANTRLFLVGMGPGDPDLVSVRALNVIRAADIVVYLEGAKEKFHDVTGGKEVIAVPYGFWRNYGKDPSALPDADARKEREIAPIRNEFIRRVRDAAARGKVIAILDSGDPLIYGPWAWILEEFDDLEPSVVPGISCFNAAHAAMKKSPTISGSTKSVILTSKDWPGKTDTIEKIAKHGASMALFTMRADFDFFLERLKAGYPLHTPVAIVLHAGNKKKEKVITGTLGTISEKIRDTRLPFEYLIYIGDFITYRQKR